MPDQDEEPEGQIMDPTEEPEGKIRASDSEFDILQRVDSIPSNTCETDNEILICINNVISTDEKLIIMLEDLSNRVQRHGKRSKYAKVAGTAATSAAIAGQIGGLVLAPFTAGQSLWLNVASTAVLIGGTMTNVSVNIADIFKRKAYVKKLEELLKTHDEAAEKFRAMIENIRYIVDTLKRDGISEEDAIFATLKHLKDGSLQIIYNITALNITSEAIKASIAAGTTLAGADAAASAAIGSNTLTNTFGIGRTAVEGMTRAEVLTFVRLIKDPSLVASGTMSATEITTSVISGAVGIAGVALSTAVTIWEVKNLVRDWKKNHPTADMIMDVIEKLRKEKESLENICLSDKYGKESEENKKIPDDPNPNINVLKFDGEHKTI